MSHLNDSFDNTADREMARMSSHLQYAGVRFPEPPPARCAECDDLIDEGEYDNPMPTYCIPCLDEFDRQVATCDLCGRAEAHDHDPAEYSCQHENLADNEDQYGNVYTVCEDCGDEVEPEDTRSFYRDEDGKVRW